MLSSQDGENFFNEFVVEIKKTKNSTHEDIGLLSFLEFCDKRVALEVNDKRILHKKYLERLDAMILETPKRKNKNFPKEKLQLIRNNFPVSSNEEPKLYSEQQETTKLDTCVCYEVYKFWTNVAYLNEKDKNLPESNINNITIIRKILNNCKDINEIKSIINFIQYMGVEQIKEIKNTIQKKQKIETLEYYLSQKDGNPKWFINKLNELSKYREQILEYSLLDPFWCYIVDFGKEESVWKKIYTKSLLDRLKTNCFQLDIKQIDDIIITVDQAYNDYNLSNEPPSIKIKSLHNFKQKSWAESILIRWHVSKCNSKLYIYPFGDCSEQVLIWQTSFTW
ncbi:38237_t:CDS:2, partial [Gigaspora margarita]